MTGNSKDTETPEFSKEKSKEDSEESVPLKPKTKEQLPDPTRFGDWEKNGRCIDF